MDPSNYQQAVLAYLQDCQRRGLRPATIRYYGMVLRRFQAATGITEVACLTVPLARAFQDKSANLAIGSMRGFLRALKTFARWAAAEELLDHDPLDRLRLPRSDRRVIVAPTDSEILAVLRASAPLLRIVVALLVGAGLRISDACSLDLADVRPAELIVARTKNRAGRVVPLDPVLERVLALQIPRDDHADSLALFVSRTGRRLSPDAVRHGLSDARRRAGVDVTISPHVIRHWHARDLAAHDTHERLMAARMGWQNHELIARYAPVAAAELVRDVERYTPLIRLRDAGSLNGLFPSSVLREGPPQRSKNVSARPLLDRDSAPLVGRQS